MKIFRNFVENNDVPSFLWYTRTKESRLFFIKLWGINVTMDAKGEIQIQPTYMALLSIRRTPGIIFLEFPSRLIMLMVRKPWFYTEKIIERRLVNETIV